jgi:hypothetical protein
MNAAEFNTEIGKVVNRAMREGIAAKKLDVITVIGCLDWHRADITRWAQDMAALAAQQQKQNGIVLPGDRGFQKPNGA